MFANGNYLWVASLFFFFFFGVWRSVYEGIYVDTKGRSLLLRFMSESFPSSSAFIHFVLSLSVQDRHLSASVLSFNGSSYFWIKKDYTSLLRTNLHINGKTRDLDTKIITVILTGFPDATQSFRSHLITRHEQTTNRLPECISTTLRTQA